MEPDDIDKEIYRTFYGSENGDVVESPPMKRARQKPNSWVFDTVNSVIAELMPVYQQKLYAKCGNALFFDYTTVTYYLDDNDMQYEFLLTQGSHNAVVGCETSFIAGSNNGAQSSELTFTLDSTTEDELRGRKYNLFLRAFVIHMACVVQQRLQQQSVIVYVASQAVNPVSLYTLAKYFTINVFDVIVVGKAKADDSQRILGDIQNYIGTHRPPLFADIKRIYDAAVDEDEDDSISVLIMIACDEENNNKAVRLIEYLLSSESGGIICSSVGGGRRRRRRSSRRRRRRSSRRRCRRGRRCKTKKRRARRLT